MRATCSASSARKCLGLGVAISLAGVLAACGSDGSESSQDAYKVAGIIELSGPLAPTYEGQYTAAKLAFDKINEDGGVDGHQIEFEAFDGQSNTSGAQSAARKALSARPTAIWGAFTTATAVSIAPTLKSAGIPALIEGAPQDMLDPSGPEKWAFVTSPYPPTVISALTQNALQVLEVDSLEGVRVGIEYLASPGLTPTMEALRGHIEADGGTVAAVETTPGTGVPVTTWASQAAKIAGGHPDIVMLADFGANISVVVPALRTAGYDGPIVAGGVQGADDALFAKLKDPGYYAPRNYKLPTKGDAMTAAAVAAGEAEDALLKPGFAAGWVRAYAIAAVLENCEFPCPPEEFISSMESLSAIEIPGDPAFTPIGFSPEKHWFETSEQYYVWDPAQEKAVSFGEPVDTSKPVDITS